MWIVTQDFALSIVNSSTLAAMDTVRDDAPSRLRQDLSDIYETYSRAFRRIRRRSRR